MVNPSSDFTMLTGSCGPGQGFPGSESSGTVRGQVAGSGGEDQRDRPQVMGQRPQSGNGRAWGGRRTQFYSTKPDSRIMKHSVNKSYS